MLYEVITDYFGGARKFEKRLYDHFVRTRFAKDIRKQQEFFAYAEKTGPGILADGRALLESTLPVLTAYHEARSQIHQAQTGNRVNPQIAAFFTELNGGLELV